MTFDQLEQLRKAMEFAYQKGNYSDINELVVQHQSEISMLSASSDTEYNEALKAFIDLYLEIQSYCKTELESVSSDLKKFNKAKKGLEQYNKASNRA